MRTPTVGVTLLVALCVTREAASQETILEDEAPTRISRWDSPRRGANYVVSREHAAQDIADAKSLGMNVLRVFVPGVPRGWPEDQDYFTSPRFEADLGSFDRILDTAADAQMPLIIVGGSVPGRQWLWHEHGRGDQRIWRHERWHGEFAAYWLRLAERYRQHRAVIAYELLNEPCPEMLEDRDHWSPANLLAFSRRVAGSAADLDKLYRRTVKTLRAVDPDMPIILDAGLWASPASFFDLEPFANDPRVLYSFHWYEPGAYTIWRLNEGKLEYPGCVTDVAGEAEPIRWDAAALERFMADPVRAWQEKHGIPSGRILCGEFSADRRAAGADAWNRDVVALLESHGWHWTYYAFREREWDAKDFERSELPMMKAFTDPMKQNRQ